MKTIKAWFSQVRHEPLREKLLRNMEGGGYAIVSSLMSAVEGGFVYERTPERADYWLMFVKCLGSSLTDYHAFLACEAQVKREVKEYTGKIPKEGQKPYVDQVNEQLEAYHKITNLMDEMKGKINPAELNPAELLFIYDQLNEINKIL